MLLGVLEMQLRGVILSKRLSTSSSLLLTTPKSDQQLHVINNVTVNEKSTATSDVILKKALTKLAHHKRTHEGLDFILLFPDQIWVMNLPRTKKVLKNAQLYY